MGNSGEKAVIFLILLFFIPMVTSQVTIPYNDDSLPKVIIETPEPTACSGGTYLLGNGTCADFGVGGAGGDVTWDYNMTHAKPWDYNSSTIAESSFWYNQTPQVTPDWLYTNYTTITFNESKLATIYYNVTQIGIGQGIIQGTLDLTQHQDGHYDGATLNITEVAGSPGLNITMNFTGVDDFNQGIMRYRTSSLAGDAPIIQVWDYSDGEWEDYPTMAESLSFATITQPVFASSTHIQDGVVQMRLFKSSNGNTNNRYYIDWVAISQGYGTPAGEEVDPLALHKTGGIMTGDINMSGNRLTDVGRLLMMGNIIPTLNVTYSLGNKTLWFKDAHIDTINAVNISTNNLNSGNITSINLNSTTVDSENVTTKKILAEDGQDIIIVIN